MNDEDEVSKTIPRFDPIKRKKVTIAYGQANDRVISLEDYCRLKSRNSAVNRWRKDNLDKVVTRCSACGWQIPKIFRTHARGKGQLTFLCIHHLLPRSEGGKEDDENLVALCPTCHEIADYLPRLICLPQNNTLKECVLNHLHLIATDPEAWTKQYEDWMIGTKKRAVEGLRGKQEQILMPFYLA